MCQKRSFLIGILILREFILILQLPFSQLERGLIDWVLFRDDLLKCYMVSVMHMGMIDKHHVALYLCYFSMDSIV